MPESWSNIENVESTEGTSVAEVYVTQRFTSWDTAAATQTSLSFLQLRLRCWFTLIQVVFSQMQGYFKTHSMKAKGFMLTLIDDLLVKS